MFWTIVIVILILIVLYTIANQKHRAQWKENYFSFLTEKFGLEIQSKIIHQEPWMGQTYEQFISMYGLPNHIEKIEMKTKIKNVLSYPTLNTSTNRPTNNKYTFENDLLSKIEVKGDIKKVWEASRLINPFEII